jgi:hypothetical protein
MFQKKTPAPPPGKARSKALSREQKLKVKKLKKKKELVELYKKKKITTEQFTKGMSKLGYSTDIEKAMEFKKYIREQIKAFENLDVSGAQEGGHHFDPNESKAKLPRDEFGNVMTDFSVSPTKAASTHTHHETFEVTTMASTRQPTASASHGGPLFGESLFKSSGPQRSKTPREEIPKGKLKRDIPLGRRTQHKIRGRDLDWDEDEEEEEEEEFVIDLDEEDFEGEKGWWDDDEWELDWDEEDEEDWEEWEIDLDEEDEWEKWEEEEEDEEEDELPPGISVEFEDDEEEEDSEGDEEEEEEDYWEDPRRRRRR